MYSVYVVQNPKGVKYVGYTSNLQLRLSEHNRGKQGSYTYKRGPWIVVYTEEYKSKDEASKREKFLKSGVGRQFVKHQLLTRGRAIGSSQGS